MEWIIIVLVAVVVIQAISITVHDAKISALIFVLGEHLAETDEILDEMKETLGGEEDGKK